MSTTEYVRGLCESMERMSERLHNDTREIQARQRRIRLSEKRELAELDIQLQRLKEIVSVCQGTAQRALACGRDR